MGMMRSIDLQQLQTVTYYDEARGRRWRTCWSAGRRGMRGCSRDGAGYGGGTDQSGKLLQLRDIVGKSDTYGTPWQALTNSVENSSWFPASFPILQTTCQNCHRHGSLESDLVGS